MVSMTNEKAIDILQKSNELLLAQINQIKELGELPEEAYGTIDQCKDEYQAVELAIDSIREQSERYNSQPLTLSELREMIGEPVYEESFGWRILFNLTNDGIVYLSGGRRMIDFDVNECTFHKNKPKGVRA